MQDISGLLGEKAAVKQVFNELPYRRACLSYRMLLKEMNQSTLRSSMFIIEQAVSNIKKKRTKQIMEKAVSHIGHASLGTVEIRFHF